MFCHDKRVCCDKQEFVMTKLLWWHKWYLWQFPPMIAQGAFQCKHQQHTLTHVQTNLQTQLWERQVKKSYWTGESGGWFWKRKKNKVVKRLRQTVYKQIQWKKQVHSSFVVDLGATLLKINIWKLQPHSCGCCHLTKSVMSWTFLACGRRI